MQKLFDANPWINVVLILHNRIVEQLMKKVKPPSPLWVSGITSRVKYHTSRHANFAIVILELLHVASLAQVLDRNVLYL